MKRMGKRIQAKDPTCAGPSREERPSIVEETKEDTHPRAW